MDNERLFNHLFSGERTSSGKFVRADQRRDGRNRLGARPEQGASQSVGDLLRDGMHVAAAGIARSRPVVCKQRSVVRQQHSSSNGWAVFRQFKVAEEAVAVGHRAEKEPDPGEQSPDGLLLGGHEVVEREENSCCIAIVVWSTATTASATYWLEVHSRWSFSVARLKSQIIFYFLEVSECSYFIIFKKKNIPLGLWRIDSKSWTLLFKYSFS